MEIAHADVGLVQIFGEVLRHALGERRHQDTETLGHAIAAFGHEVIDLGLDRADQADRVD